MTTKADLRQRWHELQRLDDASALARRKRGYLLEDLLVDLFSLEGLKPEPPYRTTGEQIDGLFELDGRIFLFEVKWHQVLLPASEIYVFRAKVEGKLIGTIGIFIAVNGFSKDAPLAVTLGKSLNVLLFDGNDIEWTLHDEHSFTKVLQTKLRYATQYGVIDIAYETQFVEADEL